MIKRQILTFAAWAAMALTAIGQSLPQFGYDNYDGWSYNNPGMELNADNIGDGRIVLYVSTGGLVLQLISPSFSCQGIDSISSTVTWFTRNIANSEFDLTRTALTLVIDDVDGNPVDSVTVTPTTPGVRTHMLDFTIPVPKGMTTARLRLVAWRANVVSSGAVRSATFTAESSSGPTTSTGDVDGNGAVNISDVTTLIDYLLNNDTVINRENADIDGDGTINIGDVTALIDKLLSGN
jgi:hypothetical protein